MEAQRIGKQDAKFVFMSPSGIDWEFLTDVLEDLKGKWLSRGKTS